MQTRNRKGGLFRECWKVHPDKASEIWEAVAIRMIIATGGTGDQIESILDSRSGRALGEELLQTTSSVTKLLSNIQKGLLDHKIKVWYSPGVYTPDEQADNPLDPLLRQDLELIASQVTLLGNKVDDWAVKERLWGCLKLIQEIRDRY